MKVHILTLECFHPCFLFPHPTHVPLSVFRLDCSGNSSLEFAWVYVCMSLMPGEAAASPDASVPGLKQPEGAATRGWGADWDLKAHTLPWLKSPEPAVLLHNRCI